MVGMTRNWIIRQLTLGEFDSHRHVWRKAIWMACKITLLAYGINLAAHWLMYQLDLLPYTLEAGLIAATVLTPTIAFSVSLAVYLVLGFAIYDLGVSHARLELLSSTDALSGLANRRAFLDRFDQCNHDRSLLVIDIDRFKQVNDKYGHAAGDQVIINVADMLVNVFGERGFCARIGGEEFAVLSCGMPFPEFAVLAELARSRMAGMRTQYDNDTISVTVSGGIAWARREQEFGETFSRADKALYTAKSSGRDRIVLSYQPVEQLEPGQTNSSVA